MRPQLLFGLTAAIVFAGPPAAAAQQTPVDTLPRYLLEEVAVTVTRAPVARGKITQKVDLIGANDLARTPGNDLTDILKKTAAVDVVQFPGLLSGVSIRGFRPQFSGINPRTLILIDGRPAGASNLATLEMAAVERIEVLRGPASALYGSSAMGGVVNVITRQSAGPFQGSATVGYGSFDTRRADLTAGGELIGDLDFDLALTSFGQHAGYRTGANRLLGDGEVVKLLADGREQRLAEFTRDTTLAFSQHSHRSGSLRLGYALNPSWRIDVRGAGFIANGVQNPGDVHASYDSRSLKDIDRSSAEIGISGTQGIHSLRLRAYRTVENVDYYSRPEGDNFVSFQTPTRWSGFQIQDAIRSGDHTLVAGIDHAIAEARSARFVTNSASQNGEIIRAAPFSPNSAISSSAAFAEGRVSLLDERLTGTLGGRLDRVDFDVRDTELLAGHRANRESHIVFNPSAGLRYTSHGGLSVRGSGGRAFVTPDAFNVAGYAERAAGPGTVTITRGNPDLRPESSVSWDAGIGFLRPASGMDFDLTYFRTDVRDRITVLTSTTGGGQITPSGDTIRTTSTYINVDEAEIRGLEASLAYDLGALAGWRHSLRLFTNASRIFRAEQMAGGVRSPILNVADLNVNAGVEFDDLERLAARLTGRYVGERQDTDFSDWMNPGTVTFPSFLVLDAAADVRVGNRYTLGARVENITDENYYEVRGYPLPGRALRLQLGVAF
jgi:outer membrane receptor protein involved in Fe transport